jgi:hypothetical protein
LILKKDVEDETSNNQIIFGKQTFRYKNDVCFGTENENEEKGNEMKKINKITSKKTPKTQLASKTKTKPK